MENIKTVYKGNKNFATVVVSKKELTYGKRFGVTKKEAEHAYIEGFMEQARKNKNTKWRQYKGIDFIFK